MYNSSFLNNNDENIGQNVSQEYSAPTYHEMQPASFAPTPQPPSFVPIPQPPSFDGNRYDVPPTCVYEPRFDSQRPVNQPLSSIINSTPINGNNYVAPITMRETPAKRRRAAAGTFVAPSTTPLPRKRFDPTLQSTGASQMNNLAGGASTSGSRVAATASKSITEATQNGFHQSMKPFVKLCEETNQLIKDLLKQTTDLTTAVNELVNSPRELKKTTEQLSHIVHMQAMVLQTRNQNDDEDLIMELNRVDLGHVPRGASLNTTARSLVRAAYGESASFHDLAPGEFDLLLGFIARIHGLNATSVFANSQSVKNSLQQMKHDIKKNGSSGKSTTNLPKRRFSTTTDQISAPHEDEDEDDDDDDQ